MPEHCVFRTSPVGLLGNQASHLALHGVLDVTGRVEANGGVVGRADHLTLVINVCRSDERLRSAVVSHADRFILLPGAELAIKEEVTLGDNVSLGADLLFCFQADFKRVCATSIHDVRRPQSGFIPGCKTKQPAVRQ